MQPMPVANMSFIDLCRCYHNVNAIEYPWTPQGPGLANDFALNSALERGDYKFVLLSVWTEKNFERKIAWLRSKEHELHVPLLYELAIAECEGGSHDTVTQVCFPLIAAAGFRAEQDVFLYPQYLIEENTPDKELEKIYWEALRDRLTAFIVVPNLEATYINAKVEKVANDCLSIRLPKTTWMDLDEHQIEVDDQIDRKYYAEGWLENPS